MKRLKPLTRKQDVNLQLPFFWVELSPPSKGVENWKNIYNIPLIFLFDGCGELYACKQHRSSYDLYLFHFAFTLLIKYDLTVIVVAGLVMLRSSTKSSPEQYSKGIRS